MKDNIEMGELLFSEEWDDMLVEVNETVEWDGLAGSSFWKYCDFDSLLYWLFLYFFYLLCLWDAWLR